MSGMEIILPYTFRWDLVFRDYFTNCVLLLLVQPFMKQQESPARAPSSSVLIPCPLYSFLLHIILGAILLDCLCAIYSLLSQHNLVPHTSIIIS
jgi:hypothetical protein